MTTRPPPPSAPLFAGTFYTPEVAQAHRRALDALRGMSSDQLFATMVAAGIYAPDGTLLPPYAAEADDASDAPDPARRATR